MHAWHMGTFSCPCVIGVHITQTTSILLFHFIFFCLTATKVYFPDACVNTWAIKKSLTSLFSTTLQVACTNIFLSHRITSCIHPERALVNQLNLHFFQVSLLTENGNTKDDLRLPTDDTLLTQVYIVPNQLAFGLNYRIPFWILNTIAFVVVFVCVVLCYLCRLKMGSVKEKTLF